MSELTYIELTPVTLNHNYFAYIKAIVEGGGEGKLDRELYGFSLDDVSFEGEILTLNKGLKHYEFISKEMKRLKQDHLFYY